MKVLNNNAIFGHWVLFAVTSICGLLKYDKYAFSAELIFIIENFQDTFLYSLEYKYKSVNK